MNKSKEISSRSKFAWNMVGSMSNALASFVLLTMVTRLNGSNDGGLFSLAFSTAQMLTAIGCFETRAIQVTDVKRKLEFKDYFTFRFMTSMVMMLCTIVFGITLAMAHNLLLSSIAMCVAELVFIAFFDYRLSKNYEVCKLEVRLDKWKKLFQQCFPLFIGSFMLSYMINASRYAIDGSMSNEMQNYYGFLLMPAFVINLFSLFGFRPMLTPMANYWNEKNRKGFVKIVRNSLIWIGILTVGAVSGAYLLGIWFLNIISGLDLSDYRIELVIVMLGGSMNAIITVCYYVLTVMRKQFQILAGYGVGFFIALIVPRMLVKSYGLTGAVAAYGIPMAATVICFMILIVYNMKRVDWTVGNEQD